MSDAAPEPADATPVDGRLALGATVAVAGVVWDVLLRPLDLRDPDSLVVLTERMPETGVTSSPTSAGLIR